MTTHNNKILISIFHVLKVSLEVERLKRAFGPEWMVGTDMSGYLRTCAEAKIRIREDLSRIIVDLGWASGLGPNSPGVPQ